MAFNFRFHTEWNETEGARLLQEMRVYLRPRRLKAEEAQGPPAERERLKCNETLVVQNNKNYRQRKFPLRFHTEWNETEGTTLLREMRSKGDRTG
ncbi:hypothetical protein ABE28_007080 [Peribacillus muralis]|uniref:Uncharacterized protein n=1 Tax=Peribacillus muralis TaxID=264697 RepID=A0A1B3XLL6_9BACI|nr:hypothetical protein ABE28_007080 [Peribacillus muralis]